MTSSSVEKISAKPEYNSSDKKYLVELYWIMKSNCIYKTVQEPVCFYLVYIEVLIIGRKKQQHINT